MPDSYESSDKGGASDIIEKAKKFLAKAEDFESVFRPSCKEAVRFVRERDQWPAEALRARNEPGRERPAMVFDRTWAINRQVINGIRQNTPSIHVRAIGQGADDDTADILDGLIRQIERHSKADAQYEAAMEWAVDGGIGYLVVMPEYLSDSSFDRIPVIKAVPDPFTVYFDMDSVEFDGSDAERALIIREIAREVFDRDHGTDEDDEVSDFPATETSSWVNEKTVIVGTYFCIEYTDDELLQFADGSTLYKSDIPEDFDLAPYPIKRSRAVKRRSCHVYELGGDKVFDHQDLRIPYIPVVPVYGEMWISEGRRKVQGLTHHAMDAQRAYNYSRTTAVELTGLARNLPPIVAADAIAGFEDVWSTANVVNHAYLPFNHVDENGNPVPAPGYRQYPQIPTALIQEQGAAVEDLKASTGVTDPGRGQPSSASSSGKKEAILQAQAAQGTSHYAQNLGRSVEQVGRIVLAMIPQIYTEEQVIHVLAEDGTQSAVRINPNQENASQEYQTAQGKIEKAFRLDVGEYNVTVVTGPTYTSRKQEAAETLMQLTQSVPQIMQVAAPKIIRYLDIPGGDDIADAVQRAMPPQLQDPEDGDKQAKLMAHPAVQAMQQQLQQAGMATQAMQQQMQELQVQAEGKRQEALFKQAELALKQKELGIKEMEAKGRLAVDVAKAQQSQTVPEQPELSPVEKHRMDLEMARLQMDQDRFAQETTLKLLEILKMEEEQEMAEGREETQEES